MFKKVLSVMFNRIVLTIFLILIQIVLLTFLTLKFASYHSFVSGIMIVISVVLSLVIIRRDGCSSYKLIWIFIMCLFPILGGMAYILFGDKRPARRMNNRISMQIAAGAIYTRQDATVFSRLEGRSAGTAKYISEYGGFPIWQNSSAQYFKCGEEFFPVFIDELEKAEHFIFMEYFIIAKGYMWDTVLGVLERKAAKGVDVRIIYDDMGCMAQLPRDYINKLAEKNIKAMSFNRFIPVISVIMNHRDHRKITVIDGHTAFTGGINLSDEYINKVERFGYWKDTAVMIQGDAVINFTVMFSHLWNAFSEDKINCGECMPHSRHPDPFEGDLFVQPFSDSPLDNEQVSENVYLDIISQAEKYVYIFTPYLIIDDQMRVALSLAAKRGVDVRIVTPGIPDKKAVFRVTRSYYQTLIAAGVKIYEYTPGFIHAKSYVCDDHIAVVGSINMDFRSLYLHFECGTFMVARGLDEAILSIKKDCLEVFDQSRPIMPRESRNFSHSLYDALLRVFSPLI